MRRSKPHGSDKWHVEAEEFQSKQFTSFFDILFKVVVLPFLLVVVLILLLKFALYG